jgi:hypothetical protein
MKKIIASAVGLMLVGGVAVTNASAVESQFGGYWRTRMFFQENFNQTEANGYDTNYGRIDTRTRLFYTAKFNDDFKFVNAFEYQTVWGNGTGGGGLGTDGDTFRIKHSYADFTLGMVNSKVGLQGGVISRGFIFDDDFAGAVVTANLGPVKVPVLYAWVANSDILGKTTTTTTDLGNAVDADGNQAVTTADTGIDGNYHLIGTMPSFSAGDNIKITVPLFWENVTTVDTYLWWLGADVDAKFDAFSAWGSLLYVGGELDNGVGVENTDVSGWLVAAGADVNIVHGQVFYASGDDSDADENAFIGVVDETGASRQSYYWSEIMGHGIFDNDASIGSPATALTNIWAANLGVTLKPMDKMSLTFDAWYAAHAEDVTAYNNLQEDELGFELDAKLTYALMDNLNADVVFAYLFAGDATGPEDVYEGGVRLSLSF